MSFSPAYKHLLPATKKGNANAAPDSLLRTPTGHGLGSSSRLMLASWKKSKKVPENSSPHHLPNLMIDGFCNNDSVYRDVPARTSVFSFERPIYEFGYEEGSTDNPVFGCPSSTKLSGRLVSARTGQTERRFSSKKRNNKPCSRGGHPNQAKKLRLISLFEEDQNGGAQPAGPKSRKFKPYLHLDASQPLLPEKGADFANRQQPSLHREFSEDPIAQFLKIEPDSELLALGKRTSNRAECQPRLNRLLQANSESRHKEFQVHPKKNYDKHLSSNLLPDNLKSSECMKNSSRKLLDSSAANRQSHQVHHLASKTNANGLVIQTADPQDFYSDSETQQTKPYDLSALELAEMGSLQGKSVLKSDSAGPCCKLEDYSSSPDRFGSDVSALRRLFGRLLLPAVSSSDLWTNRTLQKGLWLSTSRDPGIAATLTVAEDAEVFDLSRLQVCFNQHLQLSLRKTSQRAYLCKYCGCVFKSGCALGGHISKIHRGVNLDYSVKMQQRKEARAERERSRFLKKVINAQR